MKKDNQKSTFIIVFFVSLGLFTIANFISYPMSSSIRISPKIGLLDDGYAYGFPFASYFVWDGHPRETTFVAVKVMIDLFVAFVCSLAIGLICKKFMSPKATTPSRFLNFLQPREKCVAFV